MCEVSVSGGSVASAILMIVIPLFVFGILKFCGGSFGKQYLDWNSTKRLADILYLTMFLYVVLESSKQFQDVVCYIEREEENAALAASAGDNNNNNGGNFESNLYKNNNNNVLVSAVQCPSLGCEVLWDQDPMPSMGCDVCSSHTTASTALLMMVWFLQIPTSLVVGILSTRKEPTTTTYTTYKLIHTLNAIVWFIVSWTIHFYRCDCRWSTTATTTTSFFAPLALILLILTNESQRLNFYPIGQKAILTGIEKPKYKHLNGKEVIILSEPNPQTGRREVVLADDVDVTEEELSRLQLDASASGNNNINLADISFVQDGQRKSIRSQNLKPAKSSQSKKKLFHVGNA